MNASTTTIAMSVTCFTLMLLAGASAEAQSTEDLRAAEMNFRNSVQALQNVNNSLRLEAASEGRQPDPRQIGRIVNGDLLTPIDSAWQFTVSLHKRFDPGFSHICGGSFISPNIINGNIFAGWRDNDRRARWVITAAHCVVESDGEKTSEEKLRIQYGALSISDQLKDQDVENVFVHPNYDRGTHRNDVALLKLKPVEELPDGSTRSSILLPDVTSAAWLYDPYTAYAVQGWGRTSEGGPLSAAMRRVRVPNVDRDTCQEAYDVSDMTGMFCAGYSSGGYDSCQGDSGGPIFYHPVAHGPHTRPVLAGVVSWGFGCARPGFFGVYARVDQFLPWIEGTVLENS